MSSKFRGSSSHRQQQQQQQLPGVTSATGPTIWQIYFDDDEGGAVKVKVDPAAMVDPHRDDDDDDEAEVMTADIGSNAQTHQPSLKKDTEIHIQKTGEPNVSLRSNQTSTKESSLTIGFGTFENISGSGKRILIRRDSDLEFLLPPGSSRLESWKKSSVASWCSDRSTWKKLMRTTVLAVGIAVVYAVAMVAILKGIGGY